MWLACYALEFYASFTKIALPMPHAVISILPHLKRLLSLYWKLFGYTYIFYHSKSSLFRRGDSKRPFPFCSGDKNEGSGTSCAFRNRSASAAVFSFLGTSSGLHLFGGFRNPAMAPFGQTLECPLQFTNSRHCIDCGLVWFGYIVLNEWMRDWLWLRKK